MAHKMKQFTGTFPSGLFYSLKAKTLEGESFDFASLKGKVVMITNVACMCGFTDNNYKKLVELDRKYGGQLAIVAFPSNEFGAQEPKPAKEIREFVSGFGVKFHMMEKTCVNGPDTHAVYQALKTATGTTEEEIKWNFETKFLISKDGLRVERFGKAFEPDFLVPHIERLLAEEAKL